MSQPVQLSDCFADVDSPEGRRRVAEVVAAGGYPHYEASTDRPGLLVRIEEDGTRTTGRFVKRRFVPEG